MCEHFVDSFVTLLNNKISDEDLNIVKNELFIFIKDYNIEKKTTATDCLERGMNVTQIQKMFGHENVSTTMIYAKVSQNDIKSKHMKCVV